MSADDESLLCAAARILARHHDPDWRPSTDAEFDAWGHGYGTAARDRRAQEAANQVPGSIDCEWPPVTPPGGERRRIREVRADTRHWPQLPECGRCARDACDKCVDRRDAPNDGDVTCGCGCWTWAADHAR